MIKIFFSIFFSLSFLMTSVSPTLGILSDDYGELIELYDSNSEEDKKSENQLEKDLFLYNNSKEHLRFNRVSLNNLNEYNNIKYSIPHLNIISPPPDLV